MALGKAFLLVGHKQWGKSRALKALTNNNHHLRHVTISRHRLFIRRMSNDDKPSDFRSLIRNLLPSHHEFVILAFCPTFGKDATEILKDLSKNYVVHSFVLGSSHDGERHIAPVEITALRKFGVARVFDRKADSVERAGAFRALIERHLR
jgi:hypothetical protein